MERATKRKHATVAAILSGLLMIASGTVGSTSLIQLGYRLLAEWLPFLQPVLFGGLILLLFIASLGGLGVLLAAWLLHEGRTHLPKLLITISVGAGLLGLAFHLMLVTVEGGDPILALIGTGTTLSGIAVLLSIYARIMV